MAACFAADPDGTVISDTGDPGALPGALTWDPAAAPAFRSGDGETIDVGVGGCVPIYDPGGESTGERALGIAPAGTLGVPYISRYV